VGFRYSGERANRGRILVGDGYEFRDSVHNFADLAIMRLNRLHNEFNSLVDRHSIRILQHS